MKSSNKVKKPFYKRWWFIAFIAMAAMGGIMELLGIDTDGEKATEPSQEVVAKKEKEEPKKEKPVAKKKKLSKKEKKAQEKEKEEAKAKEDKIIAEKKAEEKEKQRAIDSDITNLSDEAKVEQKGVLSQLAQQRFDQVYPYKGSRMHIMGTLQDWTARDGKWFYKTTATVVNEYGAKMDVDLEVHIEPTTPDSGMVEVIGY